MDVKPWDDETDMAALEAAVRSIEQDGLLWGASKLVPIGYGIKKLQITLVVGPYPPFNLFESSLTNAPMHRG
jgi:elongation factor 1-beta